MRRPSTISFSLAISAAFWFRRIARSFAAQRFPPASTHVSAKLPSKAATRLGFLFTLTFLPKSSVKETEAEGSDSVFFSPQPLRTENNSVSDKPTHIILFADKLLFNIFKSQSVYCVCKALALNSLVAEEDKRLFDRIKHLFLGGENF